MIQHNQFLFRKAILEKDPQKIDFLRGFAAVLVFVSHADHGHLIEIPGLSAIKGQVGAFGVALFFIISGYLIWRSISRNFKKHSTLGFYIYVLNRVTRICPLYFINILFCIFALGTVFKSTYIPTASLGDIIRHLFFTQAFANDVSRTINPVLWTLSYEAIFYCLVPLLFLFSRKYTGFILISSCALSIYAIYTPIPIIRGFLVFFCLFAIGIYMAEKDISPSTFLSCLSIIIGFLLLIFASGHFLRFGIGLISFGFLGLTFLLDIFLGEKIYRLIAKTGFLGFVWVGKISYSFYIWHYVVLNIVIGYTGSFSEGFNLIRSTIFTLFILGLSYLSYQLFEKPFMTTVKAAIRQKMIQAVSK